MVSEHLCCIAVHTHIVHRGLFTGSSDDYILKAAGSESTNLGSNQDVAELHCAGENVLVYFHVVTFNLDTKRNC